MIPCTEFIPAYSELFNYLDDRYGHEEVKKLWAYLFAPTGDGIPLINYARKDGLQGCWNYWSETLKEESASCTRYMNAKEGWIYSEMHHCPSKGRLLEKQGEIGITPYYDYCGHCDHYRASLEEVGLSWIRNHIHTDRASCATIIYDPAVFKGMITMDENVKKLEIRPSDHEYFHRDFHSSLNLCIRYVAETHGEQVLHEYLEHYAKQVCKPMLDAITAGDALEAMEKLIRRTYMEEKAEDALFLSRSGSTLSVQIAYCPAVLHLKQTGRIVSDWFLATTEVVMQTLASESGLAFSMDSYDPQTGAASYRFFDGIQAEA